MSLHLNKRYKSERIQNTTSSLIITTFLSKQYLQFVLQNLKLYSKNLLEY